MVDYKMQTEIKPFLWSVFITTLESKPRKVTVAANLTGSGIRREGNPLDTWEECL